MRLEIKNKTPLIRRIKNENNYSEDCNMTILLKKMNK